MEIYRRLKALLAFHRFSKILKEDWKKIKVFNSILTDLKQQGLFDMIKHFMKENKVEMGARLAFEEKYKPFTPNLNGKNGSNHIIWALKSTYMDSGPDFNIWLSKLEFEKVFPREKQKNNKTAVTSLPDDLIFEKVVPKIIDRHILQFSGSYRSAVAIQDIFDLENYYLSSYSNSN